MVKEIASRPIKLTIVIVILTVINIVKSFYCFIRFGKNPSSYRTMKLCSFLVFLVNLLLSQRGTCSYDYYVGALMFDTSYYGDEYNAILRLAVELINNKTDGWLDEETKNVNLVMAVNYTFFGGETAQDLVEWQIDWADEYGEELVGLIGAGDSGNSIPAAELGNIYQLPQISYSATATALTNFAFFARSCPRFL